MGVDASGDESLKKKLRKCRDELVKKYGDKVGMKCVQEQPCPTSTKPHPHTYPYMWSSEKLLIRVVCFSIRTDSVKYNTNTPHVGICMWVWLVDVGYMVVQLISQMTGSQITPIQCIIMSRSSIQRLWSLLAAEL